MADKKQDPMAPKDWNHATSNLVALSMKAQQQVDSSRSGTKRQPPGK